MLQFACRLLLRLLLFHRQLGLARGFVGSASHISRSGMKIFWRENDGLNWKIIESCQGPSPITCASISATTPLEGTSSILMTHHTSCMFPQLAHSDWLCFLLEVHITNFISFQSVSLLSSDARSDASFKICNSLQHKSHNVVGRRLQGFLNYARDVWRINLTLSSLRSFKNRLLILWFMKSSCNRFAKSLSSELCCSVFRLKIMKFIGKVAIKMKWALERALSLSNRVVQ